MSSNAWFAVVFAVWAIGALIALFVHCYIAGKRGEDLKLYFEYSTSWPFTTLAWPLVGVVFIAMVVLVGVVYVLGKIFASKPFLRPFQRVYERGKSAKAAEAVKKSDLPRAKVVQ